MVTEEMQAVCHNLIFLRMIEWTIKLVYEVVIPARHTPAFTLDI